MHSHAVALVDPYSVSYVSHGTGCIRLHHRGRLVGSTPTSSAILRYINQRVTMLKGWLRTSCEHYLSLFRHCNRRRCADSYALRVRR